MSDRDKFQGLCLENKNGHEFMWAYDSMPKPTRLRLQSSTYNLCPACVRQMSQQCPPEWAEQRGGRYTWAIERMEQQIREKENG